MVQEIIDRIAEHGACSMCKQINRALLLEQDDYKPGDPAPDGYLAWHEWATVQHKAGLRQEECGLCGKWNYPQEIGDQWDRRTLDSRKGPVMQMKRVCLECLARKGDR